MKHANPKSDIFVGINLGHHDTSAAVLYPEDQEFGLLVLEEERLSKAKHAGYYPWLSLSHIERNFALSEMPPSHVGFSTFFMDVDQTWSFIKEIKNKYSLHLPPPEKFKHENAEAKNILHHEAHLFSCLINLDPAKKYIIVVSDGCGSRHTDLNKYAIFPFPAETPELVYESISVYGYADGKVEVLNKFLSKVHMRRGKNAEFSPASHFTAASQVVFGDWPYSGKVMGLAGYYKGEPIPDEELFQLLAYTPENEPTSKKYFDEIDPAKMHEFERICGSTQAYFEKYMFKLFSELAAKYPDHENLVYCGGTALNCIFNEKLRRKKIFKSIWVPAWTNDEGIGIGTAVASYYLNHKTLPKIKEPDSPFLGIPYTYTEDEVKKAFSDFKVTPLDFDEVAGLIANKEIIAWYEGRSECGPRALGHRSILCSPFIEGIRDYLNDKIKMRERFRPYGCSVLEEQQCDYFEEAEGLYSPYMSFAPVVKEDKKEVLRHIMHVDGTIRIQTVDKTFPSLQKLLRKLKEKTGDSLVIHTSLNINKQPILETLDDAVKFMKSSELKFMVFNDYLIRK